MSKIIKIISNKIAKDKLATGSRSSFIEYTNNLSDVARTQQGFISSTSYWKNPIDYNCFNQKIEIISISEWQSIQDWNKWYYSELRKNINNNYKNIINKEDFHLLLKKTSIDDIFLL